MSKTYKTRNSTQYKNSTQFDSVEMRLFQLVTSAAAKYEGLNDVFEQPQLKQMPDRSFVYLPDILLAVIFVLVVSFYIW
jgi:hypothetical protein